MKYFLTMPRAAVLAAALVMPVAGAFATTATAAASLPATAANTDATPGWTGRTLVIGSHSSIAGDMVATHRYQTGTYSRG